MLHSERFMRPTRGDDYRPGNAESSEMDPRVDLRVRLSRVIGTAQKIVGGRF